MVYSAQKMARSFKRDCKICEAETNALISCATLHFCLYIYVKNRFIHDAAHMRETGEAIMI